MFPHERSLVEKMKDKPFVLLGVNADNTVADLKKCVAKEKLNWRSWFDGPSGAIASLYRIHGFPTIYILDQKGVIRFKDKRGEEMDAAIQILLKEGEALKSAKAN